MHSSKGFSRKPTLLFSLVPAYKIWTTSVDPEQAYSIFKTWIQNTLYLKHGSDLCDRVKHVFFVLRRLLRFCLGFYVHHQTVCVLKAIEQFRQAPMLPLHDLLAYRHNYFFSLFIIHAPSNSMLRNGIFVQCSTATFSISFRKFQPVENRKGHTHACMVLILQGILIQNILPCMSPECLNECLLHVVTGVVTGSEWSLAGVVTGWWWSLGVVTGGGH